MEILCVIGYVFAVTASGFFVYGAVRLLQGHPLPAWHLFGNSEKSEKRIAHYGKMKASISDPLLAKISKSIAGDATEDPALLARYSRDTSIFKRVPRMVIFPKSAADVATVVRITALAKSHGEDISITGRSAGTDMSGGPLTRSLVAVFTKYMNAVLEVGNGYAVVEPGALYRDFEKQTLARDRQLLPSYPASREIAAMGGIINNNSGGERSLEYGKTEDYVEELEVVLADGSITTFKELTPSELALKKELHTFEGSIYRKMSDLVAKNRDLLSSARPTVSKNSSGYALWNIENKETGGFNLAKVITGAQGTLALTTKMRVRLVTEQGHRSMLVIFLKDIEHLPEIVRTVLTFNPESFESFDEHTLSLAVKFLPQLLVQMGPVRALRLGFSFLPEVGMVVSGGIPNLILMAEFSEDTHEEALAQALSAKKALQHLNLQTAVMSDERAAEKYWIVRRESFALLRKNSKGLYAAPFIDDFVVPPEKYGEFLPKLSALLAEYKDSFIYTIAGHIGNGNFHIIPLMDLSKEPVRNVIMELGPKVYELVLAYSGTTTGEHNDGIIRTPYIEMQYGKEVAALFKQTKDIFDPHSIFNPGKKVGGTFEDIKRDMITSVS